MERRQSGRPRTRRSLLVKRASRPIPESSRSVQGRRGGPVFHTRQALRVRRAYRGPQVPLAQRAQPEAPQVPRVLLDQLAPQGRPALGPQVQAPRVLVERPGRRDRRVRQEQVPREWRVRPVHEVRPDPRALKVRQDPLVRRLQLARKARQDRRDQRAQAFKGRPERRGQQAVSGRQVPQVRQAHPVQPEAGQARPVLLDRQAQVPPEPKVRPGAEDQQVRRAPTVRRDPQGRHRQRVLGV